MHKNWSALNQQKQRGIKPISKLITPPKIFTSTYTRTRINLKNPKISNPADTNGH